MTIKQMKKYFNDNSLKIRHDLKAFKYSINKISKELKTDSKDIFLLIVENKPVLNLYTHSYNFHTRAGREIINNFKYYYYNYLENN